MINLSQGLIISWLLCIAINHNHIIVIVKRAGHTDHIVKLPPAYETITFLQSSHSGSDDYMFNLTECDELKVWSSWAWILRAMSDITDIDITACDIDVCDIGPGL